MKRGYYSILPASIRYDKNLNSSTKLFYAELTALVNEKGYCWASNGYFAELYDVTKQTISTWVKLLKEKGYIRIQFEYYEGTKNIKRRLIFINDTFSNNFNEEIEGKIEENTLSNKSDTLSNKSDTLSNKFDDLSNKFDDLSNKFDDPIKKNLKENNINEYYSINNTTKGSEGESDLALNEIKSITADKEIQNTVMQFAKNDLEMIDALKEFYRARNKLKKPLTARALKLNIKALEKLSQNRDEQIEIINQSIQKGWQSFYELPKDHPLQKKKAVKESGKYGYVF